LQFVAVVPAEVVAGIEIGPSFVIFPDLVVSRLRWQPAERTPLQDVALSVTIQFQGAGLPGAIPAIGQNDQNLTFHLGAQSAQKNWLPPLFSSSGKKR
jgi:hypothetical protein